ncbi:hypothetical protein OSTOST_22679 [Ostertagia ostertagi]
MQGRIELLHWKSRKEYGWKEQSWKRTRRRKCKKTRRKHDEGWKSKRSVRQNCVVLTRMTTMRSWPARWWRVEALCTKKKREEEQQAAAAAARENGGPSPAITSTPMIVDPAPMKEAMSEVEPEDDLCNPV